MKTLTYISIMLISLIGVRSQAQDETEGNRADRIAELRRAFIAEKLALTPQQDKQFWPIYDQYVLNRKAISKKIRKGQLLMDNGSLTESELLKTIDELTIQRKLEVETDAQFVKNAIPIIGVEKASQLATIEREFKKTLIRKIREKRQQRK